MIIYYSNYDCQSLTKRRKWRKAFWSGSQMGADKRNRTLLRTRVVKREKKRVRRSSSCHKGTSTRAVQSAKSEESSERIRDNSK